METTTRVITFAERIRRLITLNKIVKFELPQAVCPEVISMANTIFPDTGEERIIIVIIRLFWFPIFIPPADVVARCYKFIPR